MVWNMPSLDIAWIRKGPRPNNDGREGAGGRAGPQGAAGAAGAGVGATWASVTAPSPGAPTPLRAGLRRPPKPPPAKADGKAAGVGRVTLAVIPPGQATEAGEAGAPPAAGAATGS